MLLGQFGGEFRGQRFLRKGSVLLLTAPDAIEEGSWSADAVCDCTWRGDDADATTVPSKVNRKDCSEACHALERRVGIVFRGKGAGAVLEKL